MLARRAAWRMHGESSWHSTMVVTHSHGAGSQSSTGSSSVSAPSIADRCAPSHLSCSSTTCLKSPCTEVLSGQPGSPSGQAQPSTSQVKSLSSAHATYLRIDGAGSRNTQRWMSERRSNEDERIPPPPHTECHVRLIDKCLAARLADLTLAVPRRSFRAASRYAARDELVGRLASRSAFRELAGGEVRRRRALLHRRWCGRRRHGAVSHPALGQLPRTAR